MCLACTKQLQLSWIQGKAFDDQPRYRKDNKDCRLWTVLGPLNNWRIITIVDNSSSIGQLTSGVTRNVFRETLQDRAFSMSSLIVPGNFGAIATTDASASSGYYVFTFNTVGYVLQDQINTNSERIPAGELVCDITWLIILFLVVPECIPMDSRMILP